MNRTLKYTLLTIGIVGTGIGIWLLFFKKKGGSQFPDVDDRSKNEKINFLNTNSSKYTGEGDPLKIYSKGENVKCLQKWLNVKGCKDKNGSGLDVDGYFGPLTESALKNCGYASGTISLNNLTKEVTTSINAGETIDCSSSSCCANISIVVNSGNQGCDGDWDCDGVPDMIDKDVNPNAIYVPQEPYTYQPAPYPYSTIDTTGPGLFAFTGKN